MWYIGHQETHVHAFKLESGVIGYYILSQNNKLNAKKITKTLIEKYEAACNGHKDARIKSLKELLAVCTSIHYIIPTSEACHLCECEGNPASLVCDCKGFKGHGICSHVLAINHILKQYNVRQQLAHMGKRSAKMAGGNTVRPPPALARAPAREPDSSDDEEAELLRLGAEGK